jgi:hypothetical protein
MWPGDALTPKKWYGGQFLERRGHTSSCEGRERDRADSGHRREFIFPKEDMAHRKWLDDNRLLVLGVVGLSLSVLMLLPIGGFVVFYAISLYFSVIWGIFFYYFFKTRQVRLKTTISVFFLTQLAVFPHLLVLNKLNFFYLDYRGRIPVTFGVNPGAGVTRGICQDDALLFCCAGPKADAAQTQVYYGLKSGIAFGVFEVCNTDNDQFAGRLYHCRPAQCGPTHLLPFLHPLERVSSLFRWICPSLAALS